MDLDPSDGFTDVRYDVDQGVATITWARPDVLNAMTVGIIRETMHSLEIAAQDDGVRAIIITGEGRAFCAGGDVRRLGDRATGGEELVPQTAFERRAWLRRTQRMIVALRQVEKPIIAAVNGVAAGGGFDLACASDIRIASDWATFCEIFAKIGLFPGTGGTYFLPRIVGIEKALELIWTGDTIDAQEALRIGLVSRVVPHADLLTAATEFARRLAAGPPLALALGKAAVYRGLDTDFHAALDYASTAEAITLSSEDHIEGINALREKRRPEFRGR